MDRKSIAQRLLKLRGTTPRRQVATACNIKLTALANYESGLRIPRDDVKVRLAAYYGVTVESLFFR
jgi:transcriptional regulator with XRE-family HTH domain